MMYKLFMVIVLHYMTSLHSLTSNINKMKTVSEKKMDVWEGSFSAYFKV